MQFYTASEYRAELIQRLAASGSGDRVLLMTMTFDPDEPAIASVMEAALAAGERGAMVTLGVDAHSFLLHETVPGPLWYHRTLPQRLSPYYRRKLSYLDRLNAIAGCKAQIIHSPRHAFSLPVAGRSHIKIALINDYFYLGGCNLQASDSIDMMVGLENRAAADRLYAMLIGAISHENVSSYLAGQDQRLDVTNRTEILIDAGVRQQSSIMEKALETIQQAKHNVFMTNQFFPNGATAQALTEAIHRGIAVQLVFSNPSAHDVINRYGQYLNMALEYRRVDRRLFAGELGKRDPFLHAKLLVADSALMLGSHNYVNAGVRLGTAEIALYSTEPNVANAAITTFERALSQARQGSKA